MGIHISKSKFVAAYTRCNKYAWLDKYHPEQKAPVDEFTESLFDNGHKVGALAKEYFKADVDVTQLGADGRPDLDAMIRCTQHHLALGTPVIAEASFEACGMFCSVDILIRNPDGSYDLCEVKSSKPLDPTKKNPLGVKEKYIVDAAFQRLVLKHCGIKVNRAFVVLLSPDYVRGSTLELDKYFVKCDVTAETEAMLDDIAFQMVVYEIILNDTREPHAQIGARCNKCDYFAYCSRNIPKPSPFDVYGLKFNVKCRYYQDSVDFRDIPKINLDLSQPAQRQIAYYDRKDAYVDKAGIRDFLDQLVCPLYSLDFETYQAVVPEHPGMKTYEQIPFQYSLHRIDKPDPDLHTDLQEHHLLDLTGGDPRRGIAESLVANIPFGATILAYHSSTESGVIARLADAFPDLENHLRSFTYCDPLSVFKDGYYYTAAMGNSLSLKSVSPAMFPDDPDMNYKNLEGSVKNGTQAMNAVLKAKNLTPEELEELRRDLIQYCALDTLAVVKILKKFYELTK